MSALQLGERAHLHELVLAHPAIIGTGAAVITSEYDRRQTFSGAPVLDRLDVLAVADGRLVVVELKPETCYQLLGVATG